MLMLVLDEGEDGDGGDDDTNEVGEWSEESWRWDTGRAVSGILMLLGGNSEINWVLNFFLVER